MASAQTGTYLWEEIRQLVTVFLPDDVALQRPVLVALRGRLPLDHDGLICAAACDDRLRGGAGRLLGERESAEGRGERANAE